MFGRKEGRLAAREALEREWRGEGTQAAMLAAIEPLQARDAAVYKACHGCIVAGNPKAAVELLGKATGAPDIDRRAQAGQAPASAKSRASAAAWAAWGTWAAIAAVLWTIYPGHLPAAALLAVGWIVTIAAAIVTGKLIGHAYEEHSSLEIVVKLIFLLVLVPVGFIQTLFDARRLSRGILIGQGRGPQMGGGYSYFEKIDVGTAAKPTASVLLSVALGYPAALAALVIESGLLDIISIG